MDLTIRGFSTALFSTWYFVEELGLLFDAGDGVSALLASKSRKVKHVFISHADRDHLTGLIQFIQLNGQANSPVVHYPADCGSFPSLEQFSRNFDPHVPRPAWVAIRPGDEIRIGKDIVVQVIRNGHVQAPEDKSKSLSFLVQRLKRKLRAEFSGLSGKQIAELRKEKTEAEISEEVRENILGYSGDTPVENDARWNKVPTLIHEATFLDHADCSNDPEAKRNKHSTLPEVMDMVAGTEIQRLILGHFSSRYSDEQISAALQAQLREKNISIPVRTVLPGRWEKIMIRNGNFSDV